MRTDGMTSVGNRTAFDKRLADEVSRADRALYAAKEHGRNRIQHAWELTNTGLLA